MNTTKEKNATRANTVKPASYFLDRILIPIAAIKGLWDLDVEEEFNITDEQKEFVSKTKAIFDDARFDKMTKSIVNRHQQLYDLWEKQVSRTGEQPEQNCPKSIGGDLKLVSGQTTKKALLKMEKELKKAEDEVKRKAVVRGRSVGHRRLSLCSGKARVVSTIQEAHDCFEAGDILVTGHIGDDHYNWRPLIQRATVVVMEKGTRENGLPDSGSRDCRIGGIPCIVETGNATVVLKSGQTYIVDSMNGCIYEAKS